MKRLQLSIFFLFTLIPLSIYAAEKTVTINWTIADISDVQGYKMYYSYDSSMVDKMLACESSSPTISSLSCPNVNIDSYPVYFTIASVTPGGEFESSPDSYAGISIVKGFILGDITQTPAVKISQANWTLVFCDSQETTEENGAAINAFDGDINTIWHTGWSGGSPPPPHEIQIDLGAIYSISGFKYLPRQDGEENGRVNEYKVFISQDGTNWTNVANGFFENSATEQEVTFASNTGRFFRFQALSEVNGNPWTSLAEINVIGE